MKGSVASISMIRTFFSINLHLLIFPLGEMRNQMLGIKSFHHQQKGFFQRHSLPYLTPEIQPCCLSLRAVPIRRRGSSQATCLIQPYPLLTPHSCLFLLRQVQPRLLLILSCANSKAMVLVIISIPAFDVAYGR